MCIVYDAIQCHLSISFKVHVSTITNCQLSESHLWHLKMTIVWMFARPLKLLIERRPINLLAQEGQMWTWGPLPISLPCGNYLCHERITNAQSLWLHSTRRHLLKICGQMKALAVVRSSLFEGSYQGVELETHRLLHPVSINGTLLPEPTGSRQCQETVGLYDLFCT